MPSDAIYEQTAKNFKDYDHPYRKVLDFAAPMSRRAAILERRRRFSRADVMQNFGVLLLMLQASARESKEQLRMFRDSGGFMDFFPSTDASGEHQKLLDQTPNLDTHGTRLRVVKYSLANVLRILRPILVIDEGHKAYSDNARETLLGFNPRFILELSATPKSERSNILVDVRGETLKKEQMIKLPIHLENITRGDWRQTLSRAYERLKELDQKAQKSWQKTNRYIRPILLVRVERTGKDQRKAGIIHAEDAKDYLVKELGMKPEEVRIKGGEKNETRDDDLLSPFCPVRAIITKYALQEGWDCPFAYVLALLDKGTANTALTQMIGRVLRQPYAEATGETDLDMAHVFCFKKEVNEAVEHIRRGLEREGLSEMEGDIYVQGEEKAETVITIQRRLEFRGKEIALPVVLHGKGKKMRPLDYSRDILSGVEWSALHHKQAELPIEKDMAVTKILIGIGEDVGETHREHAEGRVNAAFFARQLSGIVPNPWQAYRIAEDFMPALASRDPQELFANRMNEVQRMQDRISKQVDEAAKELFQRKVCEHHITFRLEVTQHGWKAPQKFSLIVPAGRKPKYLTRETNEPLQRGLFDKYPEGGFNKLERGAAWYLDDREAVKWWHRIAARREYSLQGWRKHAVYPDFVALVKKRGRAKKFISLRLKESISQAVTTPNIRRNC